MDSEEKGEKKGKVRGILQQNKEMCLLSPTSVNKYSVIGMVDHEEIMK